MAATKPWSERIPASIADGEAWLGDRSWHLTWHSAASDYIVLTAGEVALADQLWKTEVFVQALQGKEQPPPPALIAYTEKVERIESHD